jgi:polar amino acid transport system ATP-binding protein
MAIVTHEISFAAEVSDRVVFMEGGVIVAEGSPNEVCRAPANERLRVFLARFNA